MGLLSKLFGGGHTKEALIRALVKKRISADPTAMLAGATAEAIDGLPPEMLASLPEATIVWIVEHWMKGKSNRMPEQQIFELIETHRSMAAQGKPPASPTLASFVKYRVDLEHAGGPPLSDTHITYCIAEAQHFFQQ